MKFRQSQPEEPHINLTPLIDVVFLLLIFFMVSTTFEKPKSEISLQLPEASGEEKETEEQVLEVTIDAEGRYYVNGKEVINTQIDTLKRALRLGAGDREDPPLVISADAQTPHQSVITAMDAARQLGMLHITFATRQPAEGQ